MVHRLQLTRAQYRPCPPINKFNAVGDFLNVGSGRCPRPTGGVYLCRPRG